MIGTRLVSEIHPASEPPVDPAVVRAFVDAHEQGGFEKVLVGHSASTPDGLQVAAYGAAHSERLGFLVAHRPGFVAPTLAARSFATLDQFSGGRVAVHVISGGSDADQRRDGDHLDKDARYRRTDEYLDVLTRSWTSPEPFDHDGEHYRVEGVSPQVRPQQRPRIPIYFGGSSPAAYRVGGKHADVFALWGEPLAQTAKQIAAVHQAARDAGRTTLPRISVSFRLLLGASEEQAWERAHAIRDPHRRFRRRRRQLHRQADARPHPGQRRVPAPARRRRGRRAPRPRPLDRDGGASGAAGNSTAVVGTPETVAAAMLDYVDLGVTTLLIRGYDPIDDAKAYGRDLLPLVRAEIARPHTLARRSHRGPGLTPTEETRP